MDLSKELLARHERKVIRTRVVEIDLHCQAIESMFVVVILLYVN